MQCAGSCCTSGTAYWPRGEQGVHSLLLRCVYPVPAYNTVSNAQTLFPLQFCFCTAAYNVKTRPIVPQQRTRLRVEKFAPRLSAAFSRARTLSFVPTKLVGYASASGRRRYSKWRRSCGHRVMSSRLTRYPALTLHA